MSRITTLTLQDHHLSHLVCALTGLSLSSRAARRHLWDTPASNSTVQKPTGATAVLQQLPSNSDTTERTGQTHCTTQQLLLLTLSLIYSAAALLLSGCHGFTISCSRMQHARSNFLRSTLLNQLFTRSTPWLTVRVWVIGNNDP